MPSTIETSPASCHQRILQAFRRIIRACDLHSRRLAATHDVTGPQLVCLLTLARHAPLTSTQLARQVHVSPSTIVGIIDRLENKNLVHRQRASNDRRLILLTTTSAGRELARHASPLQDCFAERLRQLPAAEQATIAHSLERVVDLMEKE